METAVANSAKALADEILEAHANASTRVTKAKDDIARAVMASVGCAALVAAARDEWGREFPDTWRKLVGLPDDEARRYLQLNRTAHRIDKRQLLLLGIIDPPEDQPEPQQREPDPFAFCRLVPRITSSLTPELIRNMDDVQRAAVKRTLAPIVEIYNQI
jgi:hypothetical protein